MSKTELSIAIAALGAIASTSALAQDTVLDSLVEEVVVTGSRIARDPLSTSGPITVVDSEAIERSGATSIEDVLLKLPSMGTSGINSNENNGGVGLSFIDLRNLGSKRTLVLVNGRRFVSSSSGVSTAVDLNNIPVDMIERIEVLTDGASAIYGSDAVAGVVNIVTKKSIDGASIRVKGGTSEDGGGEEAEISLTFGKEGERGSFIGNLSHSKTSELEYNDRDWASLASSYTPTGNLFNDYDSFTVGADGSLTDGYSTHDIGQYMWLAGSVERTSLTLNGNYSLTDSIEIYNEATYTHKTSNQQLAAQPMALDLSSSNISGAAQQYLEDKYGSSWSDLDYTLYIRPVDGGTRDYEQETDTFRNVFGLRGDLSNGWSWDIFANYGKNTGEYTTYNSYNETLLYEVLDGESSLTDYTILGGISSNVLDYIGYTDEEDTEYEMLNFGASLTGDIEAVQLQGGALGFATGIEYRDESGEFNPSEETQNGDSFSNKQEATSGDYSVTEVYAEFNLPFLSGAKYAEELSADIALRYSDYDTFGGEGTGKLGLVYAPTEELRFRTSISTSFRAPSIYELYSGYTESYEYLSDPCDSSGVYNTDGVGDYCSSTITQISGQIATNIGGNSDLEAEEATTFTAGLVWTPSFADDLSITLDYYDIEIDNAISTPDIQTILDNCYRDGIASACELITRGDNGQITGIDASLQNIGEVTTKGVDIDITQNFHYDVGRLELNLQANRLLEYEEYNSDTGETSDYLGYVGLTSGIYVKWRGLASATWYGDDWDVGAELEHLYKGYSSYMDIPSRTYLNLNAGWQVNEATHLSAGINNVTDRTPPYTYSTSYWNSYYDYLGRYVWASVTYEF